MKQNVLKKHKLFWTFFGLFLALSKKSWKDPKTFLLGVGEIFLTSVDFEGTQKGFDSNLIEKVNAIINTPLIISGGAGSTNDISKCFKFEKVSGVALASVLHYNQLNIDQIRHTTTKDKRNNFAKSINIKKNKNDVAILKTKICNFKSLYNSLKKVCDVKVLEKDNIKNI